MGGVSAGSYPPQSFERAMLFVDGTNLFHRLEAEKLKAIVPLSDHNWWNSATRGRQLHRVYLYTSEPHLEKAKKVHGEKFLSGVRVVLGDAVQTSGGFKEKGVDALLVADLIYHAAAKNFNYAVLVSVDTDFAYAIKRAEDFGCQTGVLGICSSLPERLKVSADHSFEMVKLELINRKLVEVITKQVA